MIVQPYVDEICSDFETVTAILTGFTFDFKPTALCASHISMCTGIDTKHIAGTCVFVSGMPVSLSAFAWEPLSDTLSMDGFSVLLNDQREIVVLQLEGLELEPLVDALASLDVDMEKLAAGIRQKHFLGFIHKPTVPWEEQQNMLYSSFFTGDTCFDSSTPELFVGTLPEVFKGLRGVCANIHRSADHATS